MLATAKIAKPKRYEEILVAAAECFQKQGFSATSIDTVARHLGATKGRIYHYFPSKVDLFNAVRDRAMELAFDGIREGYDAKLSPVERLHLMTLGHVKCMMLHHSYMQVLLDGLQMQRFGATTEFQREAMERHLHERNTFETWYREVIELGVAEGTMAVRSMSVTLQSFLVALNGPVFWYRPREGDGEEKLNAIAEEVVVFALKGLGIDAVPPISTISRGA
ncbi:TetR/AcrR family transcriptional regulator [Shimia sediminis]|uniref:TetR/AcrR family transcriptional regulator n=1 Tax=Shimia sediminis TaxID=2497945 RepID=UPI0013DECC1C|nr:TetR/AcrR family transcriptional regulator [Shimia sediminis]